jgi:dTDP-glucose 4,6-dehydratase
MKKVFITGAEGFIGSHLVELLVKKNFKVKALVQYNSFNTWGWLDNLDKHIIKKVDVVLGDVRDLNEMLHNTKNQDAIIHLAALIGIPYSYVSPKNYIETNCVGTLNVMQAAKIKKSLERL